MQDASPAERLKQLDAERVKIIEDAKERAIATIEELNALGFNYSLADADQKKPKRKSTKAPKYVNPSNPEEVWSGRGKPSAWMRELLNKGHSKDEFLNPVR